MKRRESWQKRLEWGDSNGVFGKNRHNIKKVAMRKHKRNKVCFSTHVMLYNFVNMLRAHGPGTYRFRFQALLGDDAPGNTENMSPYISTSSEKHISLGPVTLSKSSWQYFEIDITQAMIDFYGLTDDKTFLRFQGNVDTLSGFYITDVNITPPVISNGIYYFKNAGTQKYMDIEGPAAGSGTQIHQWDLHGDTSQRWDVQFVSNDHYKIQSVYSGLYLSVVNNSAAQDAAIVQNSFDWLDGQLFKFERTAAGNIKITPKTGSPNNRVLCIGAYIANTNGVNIEQRNYIEDSNYIDEWIAEKRVDRYILRSFLSENIPSSNAQTVSNVVSFSQTLNGMFNRSFGVSINFEILDVTSFEAEEAHSGACTGSCGVCSNTYSPTQTGVHHRNVVRITYAEIPKMRKTGNQIHALWYSEGPETFCSMEIDGHAFMPSSAVGISYGREPVLQIFNRDSFQFDKTVDVYRYTLLHETTHIFGVWDQPGHTQDCVIGYREPVKGAYASFLNRLSRGEEAWCENCKAVMMRYVGREFGT